MTEIDDILVVVNKLAKRKYFIPSYQRGYRWEKQQVVELLDDILDFSENKGDQDYYCLQPVVVRKMQNEELFAYSLDSESEWYEVIDGQQRLTTIALVLHYFNEQFNGKKKDPEPTIKYETRDTCIDKISIDEDNVLALCEGKNATDNIDLFHAVQSYQNIHNWFSEDRNPELDTNSIMSVFKNSVKVIWYEVNDNVTNGSDAIELFTRINMGKIPLTNAELIKALFLRQRNFDAKQELRQVEIAKEWDNMEYALQNDDFWYFLNKNGDNKPARIEFLFDMIFNKTRGHSNVDAFDKQYGTDDYKTFRFFAEKFQTQSSDVIKTCWEEVQSCFSAVKEWFDDPVYYHYIGYLITCGKSIVDIYNLYDGSPKDAFLNNIKEQIKLIVSEVTYTIEDNKVVFNLSYVNNKELIRKLLLLFNIQYMIIHNSKAQHWYIRFPFDLYKKQKWDIEHINSFTTYEITKAEEQIIWIDTALEDLFNLGINLEEIEKPLFDEIQRFKSSPQKGMFLGIKKRIADIAGEDTNEDEYIKNNIGNLTLLNAEINRGYGNSLFVTKRREIINKDKDGCFIPICTKNIFLKYYDTEGSSKTIWSKANGDHDKYLQEIKEILKEFINNESE